MATWSVKPLWKKSVIERQEMIKGDNKFIIETGWRWGEFHVYTEDDNPPVLEAGVNITDCGYEAEMISCDDGCWEEYDYDDCDDETQAFLEEYFEEGNSYFELEEEGWMFGDGEFIIDCDMEIVRIDDEGNEVGEKITTESEEEPEANTDVKLTPTAKWPFGN